MGNNYLKYITLKKGNYDKQIMEIIKKFFPESKNYSGIYKDFNDEEAYLFFRGQSNYKWRLSPSINRGKFDEAKILIEHLKNFPNISDDNLIAHAQHYGEKTRALDFTSDYKIALYFACCIDEKSINEDGALYITSYLPHTTNYISALTINLISLNEREVFKDEELADFLINNDRYRKLYCKRNNIKNSDNQRCIISMLDNKYICTDFSTYLHTGFMIIYDLEDAKVSERMKKQKGCLFYCGSKYYKNTKIVKEIVPITTSFPQYNIYTHKISNPLWLKDMCVKVKIPKELKSDIMEFINIKKEDLGF